MRASVRVCVQAGVCVCECVCAGGYVCTLFSLLFPPFFSLLPPICFPSLLSLLSLLSPMVLSSVSFLPSSLFDLFLFFYPSLLSLLSILFLPSFYFLPFPLLSPFFFFYPLSSPSCSCPPSSSFPNPCSVLSSSAISSSTCLSLVRCV